MFPAAFFTAERLEGEPELVTIGVSPEKVGEETKLVATFEGNKTKLALNKHNAEQYAKIAETEDFTAWGGTKIKLTTIDTEYDGKPTKGLSVVSA